MTSAPVDPLIGQTLDDRYVVRSRIARGGMAMVYLGDDLRLGRRVAIKIMHAHLSDDENFTRRFEQEARSAAGLGHPNIVNVFDQGEAAGVPYLVMEYLPGITLRELLKQHQRLTSEQATEIAEAILSGLAAAHDAGIVHRDLKPENVLLADDGRIKIGDFGLARAVSANTTTGQALLGTIAYLSPELVTRGVADARSDVYAFGIVLFEMLTGQQPYTGEQPMQIAYQHAHSDMPLPSTVVVDVPETFDHLVRWTTHRDPDARPANAREALEFLWSVQRDGLAAATRVFPVLPDTGGITPATAVLDEASREVLARADSGSPNPHPLSATDRAQRVAQRRSRRGVLIAALLVVLLGAAGLGGWWWGQGPGSRVTVPAVEGLSITEATGLLEESTLRVTVVECSSLTIEAGRAVRTEPSEGSRVERESEVQLCESTGPELLPLPSVVGLPLEEAEQEIERQRFTVGTVREEVFDSAESGTVLRITDPDGTELPETYPEQGVIDLVLSAGPLPDLSGNTVEQATNILSTLGLNVDTGLNTSDYSDSVAEGHVISLILPDGAVRKGDTVGFHVSLGKELIEIPDVRGMSLRRAMEQLESLGLQPQTALPELLWDSAEVDRDTTPQAGTRVEPGTEVRVRASI
ncbi:MAG: Stk1 family PASTA domain-containing Ser/Thr kinase [Microbacteriaceae bacterium]|nr:Stk1 family PASTA domain-containing Ser/Thr kinase [Microbacteriaceae bacterium]